MSIEIMEHRLPASRRLSIAVLAIFLLTASSLSAGVTSFDFGEDEADLVEVFSVVSLSTVAPGTSCQAAVVVDIAPGWHINSANPYQDYLIAAEVTLGSIEGITASAINYPPGEEESLADELMSVYADRVIVLFELSIADNLDDGEYVLPVSMSYQPCNNNICRGPETVEVPLKITVGTGGSHAINESIFAGLSSIIEILPPEVVVIFAVYIRLMISVI